MSDELPAAPTSDREAIAMLADAVGIIAWRCWQALGDVESNRIQVLCNVIAEWAAPHDS